MNQMQVPDKSAQINQITKKRHPRTAGMMIISGTGLLAMIMAFSITKGAANIPLSSVWNILFHFNAADTQHLIVMDLRLPRVLASAMVGAALAVAGAVMQGVTRNPLADSGLMGLNAGAGFALSICFAFLPGLSYIQLIFLSFMGATIGAGLTYGIASLRRGGVNPMRLVLAGAAVSALLAALSQGIAMYFNVAQNVMFWTAGGVAGSNWEQLQFITPWIAVALLGAIVLSPAISIMSLGEEVAKGLGINTITVNLLCAIAVLMLAGVAVATVGAVGFVGLVVPHFTRFLVGMDYRLIIPVSAVSGSLLMVLADLGARTLNPPFETPIGALTALIGVPFFLYLSRKDRRML